VTRLLEALEGAELWAVVKADAYGHGAEDVSKVALDAGAAVLCVATVSEGAALRARFREARILVMGPVPDTEWKSAENKRLELAVSDTRFPEQLPVHVKIDTGMGRYGVRDLPPLPDNVVGLMSHLATADTDPDFAARQIECFRTVAADHPGLIAHLANSAAALRLPASRFHAARCGVALYGLSPFGTEPAEDGLEPVLSWRSELAQVKLLQRGESTGYGRQFVATAATWIGLVPVGYADGFRRDLTGAEVLVAGERRRVVGTVSMDSFAVELGGELARGTAVTIIGDGLLAEEHARRAGTINYELVCGIKTGGERATRLVTGR
jgi:alanine racemase